MEDLLKCAQVHFLHGRPYHPQSQGVVERINNTIPPRIYKLVQEHNNPSWYTYAVNCTMAYNGTPKPSTGVSPHLLHRHRESNLMLLNPADKELFELQVTASASHKVYLDDLTAFMD